MEDVKGTLPLSSKGKWQGKGPEKGFRKGVGKGANTGTARFEEETLCPKDQRFLDRFGMQRKMALMKGTYTLSAHIPRRGADSTSLGVMDSAQRFVQSGAFAFDDVTGRLFATTDKEEPHVIGTFTAMPVGDKHLPEGSFESAANIMMPCIEVVDSEIMIEIQKRENANAYFVLPSQLNGAEYPSHVSVVERIDDYKFDNTGGPRGQLAVHPGVGQFLLDNAAHGAEKSGINAANTLIQTANVAIIDAGITERRCLFDVVNGYLRLPVPDTAETAATIVNIFRANVHTLRLLVMAGVPACGLIPSKGEFSSSDHAVNLVYASAVPINCYVNGIGVASKFFADAEQQIFQAQISEAVLVAQYYGALQEAAQRCNMGGTAKVYLMPVGGGAFRNAWESIVKAISLAVELLQEADRDRLDIKALAFERGRAGKGDETSEGVKLTELLEKHRKLRPSRETS